MFQVQLTAKPWWQKTIRIVKSAKQSSELRLSCPLCLSSVETWLFKLFALPSPFCEITIREKHIDGTIHLLVSFKAHTLDLVYIN